MSEFLSSKVFTLLYVSSTLLTACQWLGGATNAAPAVTATAHSNQNTDRVDGGSGRKPQTVGNNNLIHQQQLRQYYPPVFRGEQLLALQNAFRSPPPTADDDAAELRRNNAFVDDENAVEVVDNNDAVMFPQWLLRHNDDRVPLMAGANAAYAPPTSAFSAVRQWPISDQQQQKQHKRSFAYFGDRSQPLSGLIYAPARG